MLKMYDVGSMIMSTAATNNVVKLYVNKLHDLGVSEAYNDENFAFNTSSTNASITGTQNITFKDGVQSKILFYVPISANTSYPEYIAGLKLVIFIEEEEHFILCSTTMTSFLQTKTNESLQYFIHGMCFNDWYGIVKTYIGNLSPNSNSHMNVPTIKLDNSLEDEFTLYPIYLAQEKSIPKNLYFSPDKTYPVGTLLTDNAGNKFTSVIPRFFYKTN